MDVTVVAEAVAVLRAAVVGLEGHALDATEARSLLDTFIAGERACAAGRTVAAARAEACGVWARGDGRSAAAWLADRMGTTVGQASATLDTAAFLQSLPGVREAFLSGRLSEAQTTQIAAMAAMAPEAEDDLVATAAGGGLRQLRAECERVRAAAVDQESAEAAAHARRRVRTWNADGGRHLHLFASVLDVARLEAAMAAGREAALARARDCGRRESLEAYAADALLGLAEGTGAAVRGHVVVRVDAAALARGRVQAGETCEVDGAGPLAVPSAWRLAVEGIVTALEVHGTDVSRVVSATRHIPARLRAALVERDRRCVVARCDATERLEFDHVVPFAVGGPTSYANLERKCPVHHARKTADDLAAMGSPWRLRAGPEPDG